MGLMEILQSVNAAIYFAGTVAAIVYTISKTWEKHDARASKVSQVARAVWDASEAWGGLIGATGVAKEGKAVEMIPAAEKAAGIKLSKSEKESIKEILKLYSMQAKRKNGVDRNNLRELHQ